MSEDDAWNKFENSVLPKLQPYFNLQARVDALESAIYDAGAEIFGHPPVNDRPIISSNSKKSVCINLVQSKNALLRQLSEATYPCQIEGLQGLLTQTRLKLRKLRKSENSRKKRWKKKKIRAAFKENPFKAGKDLLKPRSSIKLVVDQVSLDTHLASRYRDKMRDCPLPPLIGLKEEPKPKYKFDGSRIKKDAFSSYYLLVVMVPVLALMESRIKYTKSVVIWLTTFLSLSPWPSVPERSRPIGGFPSLPSSPR